MRIDEDKCVACGNCVAICPMGAIYVDAKRQRAVVNRDECVECYTCFRNMSKEQLSPTLVRTVRRLGRLVRWRFDPEPDVCPTDALSEDVLEWPRVVRRAFSDPVVPHESTGIHGRGTEEVKTNDVTNRIREGDVGFTVEFGRPTVGVRFYQIQEMTRALAKLHVTFEANNPVSNLMTDLETGDIRNDVLEEKVLSAIVEFKTTLDRTETVLALVDEVAGRIDTVVAVGVAERCNERGDSSLATRLERSGHGFVRGKTNLGLGRATKQASS